MKRITSSLIGFTLLLALAAAAYSEVKDCCTGGSCCTSGSCCRKAKAK
jgi:hypothetical protein